MINSLEADHIVPADKIMRMDGFEKLTREQQEFILNYRKNITGSSRSANASRGNKSFEEWTIYKKENIEVRPEYREEMIIKEKELEIKIQEMIDNFVELNEKETNE